MSGRPHEPQIYPICPTGKEQRMARNGYILRSKDVAHILDCSPDDVIELAQKKRLKAAKEGRFWRYHPRDVQAYKKRIEEQASCRLIENMLQLSG